jgi:hypothetical protein
MMKYKDLKNSLRKLASTMAITALVVGLSPFAAMAVPGNGNGGGNENGGNNPSYTINIVDTEINGLAVQINGTASATNYAGQFDDQKVQVDWGDGNVNDTASTDFTDEGNNFSGTWSDGHTYDIAQTNVTITVKVYHGQPQGQEASESATDDITIDVAPEPETGTITVTKVVINDNDGTKEVADFPLFLNGMSVTSGVATTTAPGTYTVSETSDSNYAATFSGDCDENGQITVAADESKTCTITNNDIDTSIPNTAPVASDYATSTPSNVAITITLPATDADSNPLLYSTTTNPILGILNMISGNQVIYTPTGATGTDSFNFKANDGSVDSNEATITITVTDADNTVSQCEDGIDNDEDGVTDMDDVDCTSGEDNTESGTDDGAQEEENTSPVLEILGANPFTLTVGGTYVDPGASSTDAEDGDLTGQISTSTDLNVNVIGSYSFNYSVSDSDFATTTGSRTINVVAEEEEEDNGGSSGGGGSSGSIPHSGSTTTPPVVNVPAPVLAAIATAPTLAGLADDGSSVGTGTTTDEGATTTPVELASVEPGDNNQLAAAGALGLGNWWWLLLLILAIAILGYGYYYWDERKSRMN